MTTTVTYMDKSYPVYLSGTFSKETEKSVTGQLFEIKAGALKLPSSFIEIIQEALLQIANQKIAETGDTFRMDTLEITENGLVYEGSLPSKAE